MATGMCACWADVVQEELLQQLCPEEFQRFTHALLEMDISAGEFHHKWYSREANFTGPEHEGDTDSQIDDPFQALQALINAFRTQTNGLELNICFHDTENGDRYDEVSGLFFTVSGVYKYTPAGEMYKQFIERKGWVEYG